MTHHTSLAQVFLSQSASTKARTTGDRCRTSKPATTMLAPAPVCWVVVLKGSSHHRCSVMTVSLLQIKSTPPAVRWQTLYSAGAFSTWLPCLLPHNVVTTAIPHNGCRWQTLVILTARPTSQTSSTSPSSWAIVSMQALHWHGVCHVR